MEENRIVPAVRNSIIAYGLRRFGQDVIERIGQNNWDQWVDATVAVIENRLRAGGRWTQDQIMNLANNYAEMRAGQLQQMINNYHQDFHERYGNWMRQAELRYADEQALEQIFNDNPEIVPREQAQQESLSILQPDQQDSMAERPAQAARTSTTTDAATASTAMQENTLLANRSSSSGTIPGVGKETPISIPPTITYGLQETHTTIIPWTFWLSAPKLTYTPTSLQIRLNSIYDILYKGTINASTNSPTSGELWDKQCIDSDHTSTAGFPFPTTLSGTQQAEKPWWREYFAKIYENYTVLGCEYEITMFNPRAQGKHALVAWTIQQAGPGGTNVLPETMPLDEMMAQKNMHFKMIGCRDNSMIQSYDMIKGHYKPGTVHQDVLNDGDAKTWTATGSSPNMVEYLQLMFYNHPLGIRQGYSHVNFQVRVKYMVQFKDLKNQVRYPRATITPLTTIAQTVPTDILPSFAQN